MNDSIDDYELLPEGLELIRKGKLVIRRFRKGANVDAFRDRLIQAGSSAQEDLNEVTRELFQIVSSVSPVHLLAQVIFFCMVGPDQSKDPHYFATRDSLIEYLCGIAASISQPSEAMPHPQEALEVLDRLNLIPDLVEKIYLGRKIKEERGEDVIDEIRFSLGLENLFDRMEGYTPHLEHLAKKSFGFIHSECIQHLGFAPADIPLLVRAIVERRRLAFQQAVAEGKTIIAEAVSSGALHREDRRAMMLAFLCEKFSEEITFEPIEHLAKRSGIPSQQVRLLLSAMTCPWGVQPAFRLPDHENRFRFFPVLQVGQNYSVPLPWSLLHQCFKWFEIYAQENSPYLLKRWYTARDKASELIVRDELRKIFGTDRVIGPLEYEMHGSTYEADAVVIAPPCGIAVEVKAHSLTPSGRRGAPGRLKKKAEELIELPVSQAERLSIFLQRGGQAFIRPENRRIDLPKIERMTILAVTFERIDPLSHVAQGLLKKSGEKDVWSICIADLMMVTEIICRPSEFFFYCWLRAEIGSSKTLKTTMEADILAGFLQYRLSEFIQSGQQSGGRVFLDYCADTVNDYFTNIELGLHPSPPNSGIPTAVLDELDRLIEMQHPQWPDLTERAMRQQPSEWRKFGNIVKKVRRTGTQRKISFWDPDLEVIVRRNYSKSDDNAETEIPRLVVKIGNANE
jgi:hypothetical protein